HGFRGMRGWLDCSGDSSANSASSAVEWIGPKPKAVLTADFAERADGSIAPPIHPRPPRHPRLNGLVRNQRQFPPRISRNARMARLLRRFIRALRVIRG